RLASHRVKPARSSSGKHVELAGHLLLETLVAFGQDVHFLQCALAPAGCNLPPLAPALLGVGLEPFTRNPQGGGGVDDPRDFRLRATALLLCGLPRRRRLALA